jgi:predicted dehydrogenase
MNILLIGCGNIGKRHLQAIVPHCHNVTCSDISAEALHNIPTFLEQNKLNLEPRLATTITEALATITEETIVIVATTAKGRQELIENICAKKPLAIIAEKPVTQTRKEYQALLKLTTPIYVNVSRRAYPSFHLLHEELSKETSIFLHCRYGKLGFACNGIHFLDLAAWLLDAKKYTLRDSHVYGKHETKRAGYSDFSGHALIEFSATRRALIEIPAEDTCNTISITASKHHTILEASQKIITISGKEIETKDFPIIYTSQITGVIIQDIFHKKKPALPTLHECEISHNILFDILEKHELTDLNFT